MPFHTYLELMLAKFYSPTLFTLYKSSPWLAKISPGSQKPPPKLAYLILANIYSLRVILPLVGVIKDSVYINNISYLYMVRFIEPSAARDRTPLSE